MNKEIEIPIPEKKILLISGAFNPSVKVVVSGNLQAKRMIKPVIGIGFPSSELVYLDFPTIGVATIACKLDFVEHIFAAFEKETGSSSNESLPWILTSQAMFQNLRLVMFDLQWKMVEERCTAVGVCRIAFRQQGVTLEKDISSLDPEDAIRLGRFFTRLPRI